MSFFTGFGVSAVIYYILNRAFPVPGLATKFEELDVSNPPSEHYNDNSSVSDVESSKGDKGNNLKVSEEVVYAT